MSLIDQEVYTFFKITRCAPFVFANSFHNSTGTYCCQYGCFITQSPEGFFVHSTNHSREVVVVLYRLSNCATRIQYPESNRLTLFIRVLRIPRPDAKRDGSATSTLHGLIFRPPVAPTVFVVAPDPGRMKDIMAGRSLAFGAVNFDLVFAFFPHMTYLRIPS